MAFFYIDLVPAVHGWENVIMQQGYGEKIEKAS